MVRITKSVTIIPISQEFIKLYNRAVIMANAEIGDNITDLQYKSGLTWNTTYKISKELEKLGALKFRVDRDTRGASHRVIEINNDLKDKSLVLIFACNDMKQLIMKFNKRDNNVDKRI